MLELEGKYARANVMAGSIDSTTREQIKLFLSQEIFRGAHIAIMPDTHAGMGSVIGFTMKLTDFVIPNIIGVDIGCGIEAYRLGKMDVDYADFDRFIREHVPSGRDVRRHAVLQRRDSSGFEERISRVLDDLEKGYSGKFAPDAKRVWNSIGTLGGGNHFIEIDEDETGSKWLVIHTGSRNLGKQVAEYYQKRAADYIAEKKISGVSRDLEYLPRENRHGKEYIEAMKAAQEYAVNNRRVIAGVLLGYFQDARRSGRYDESCLMDVRSVKSVHNYINFEDGVIRKGAISAHKGEELIVPLNMRDGSIIGTGKGNEEWNNSAPHGAGRMLSRTKAKEMLDMKDFIVSMDGVWSSCISRHTIDESPMAYKPKEEILPHIVESVDVNFIMKPLYNFKAVE